jgi:hypothetical protein
MPKLDSLSGGTNYDCATKVEGEDDNGINIAMLESEVPHKEYAEYVIQAAKKDVRCEDSLVRQIVYVALSKDSTNPLNLLIIAPTSEGKTYAVTKTLEYWPDFEIMYIASMSPKTLIRMHGETVDENNQPIGSKERDLQRRIAQAKAEVREFDRLRIKEKKQEMVNVDKIGRPVIELEQDIPDGALHTLEELENELEKLYKRSKTVINLQGKLLISGTPSS